MRYVSLITVIGSLLLTVLAGCGSGSSIKESFLYTSNISTTPNPLPPSGGTVNVQVTIVNPPSSDQSMRPYRSPGFDVTDSSGKSIFPQARFFNERPDSNHNGAFSFTLPSNAGGLAPKVYTITVLNYEGTAGGFMLPVGNLTVPN